MPDSHLEVYLHLVWTTAGRQPWLTGAVRDLVHSSIHADCRRLGLQVVLLGGTEDHVHVLVRHVAALSIASVVKQLKGASSHLVNHAADCEGFRWQEGYSAFSVSRWDVPKLRTYIERQDEHHRLGTIKEILELVAVEGRAADGMAADGITAD